jgi:multiple sugar transport system permease protein
MTTGKLERPSAGAATGTARSEAASEAPASSRRRSRSPIAAAQGRWTPYLFLAPYLVLFTLFALAPAVYGFWISLHDWDFTLPGKPFVGLDNYTALFSSTSVSGPTFWQSMRATGIFTLFSVPLLLVVPLAVAVLLNQRFPGRNFFRAVYFAPYVLGVAVVTVLWRYLLDNNVGLVNHYLGLVRLGPYPFTTALPWAWVAMVGMTVWWTLGFNAVIYLAGLQDIPKELYEAAKVDGAGAWARFRHVTLPGLRPVLLFVVSVTILASANMFGQAYIMTQGAPGNATRTAIYFIADEGLKRFQMGAASAMSFVLTFFLAVISLAVFFLFRQREA